MGNKNSFGNILNYYLDYLDYSSKQMKKKNSESSVGNIENSVALVVTFQKYRQKKRDLHRFFFLNLIILLKFGCKNLKKIHLKVQYSENNTI
jgi:hypothetical protein